MKIDTQFLSMEVKAAHAGAVPPELCGLPGGRAVVPETLELLRRGI